jgi:hypothetical protein
MVCEIQSSAAALPACRLAFARRHASAKRQAGRADHSVFSLNAGCADCRKEKVSIGCITILKGDPGMTKTPALPRFLAGIVLLLSGVTQAFADPTPSDMLDPKLAPKFEDVQLSTPGADELKNCSVKLVQGTTAKSNGWLLLDGKGLPLRRYFDSNGDGKVDMWSYYKDGVEVYREHDSAFKGTPNNFRWLNGGGMKWGTGGYDSKAGKWTIATWRMISAEEVAFEAFQSVAKNDPARLYALFITDNEMQMIKLPAGKAKAIGTLQQAASQKFAGLVKVANLDGVKFDGVEAGTPNCDTTNGDAEIIKYPSRAVRYSLKGNHGWIHTGEMIQVGPMAWRLVDVPSDKDPVGGEPGGVQVANPKNEPLEKLLTILANHDIISAKLPQAGIGAKDKEVDAYYRKRIELVNQILPLDKETERESWYKQLFDNMTALAQNNADDASIGVLTQLKDGIVANNAFGKNLAAYGTYRVMWTKYAVGMAKANAKDTAALQEKWLDDLGEFVTKYNKAEDTPDALAQVAIGCEFAGKIEQAKRWYKELVTSFPNHHHSPRASGSLDRLELVGKKMKLAAPILAGNGKTFDIAEFKGKLVIVHYWSKASSTYEDDFVILKRIITAAKSDVELVNICLDDDATKAKEIVFKAQAPGVHLFQASNNASGLNSPLATQYGIHILPTLFMVGRDGVVTNNALQIGDIQTELKKVQ